MKTSQKQKDKTGVPENNENASIWPYAGFMYTPIQIQKTLEQPYFLLIFFLLLIFLKMSYFIIFTVKLRQRKKLSEKLLEKIHGAKLMVSNLSLYAIQ